jgi:hypothetical protein
VLHRADVALDVVATAAEGNVRLEAVLLRLPGRAAPEALPAAAGPDVGAAARALARAFASDPAHYARR